MASRPATSESEKRNGRPGASPLSMPESGVGTIAQSPSPDGAVMAGELAEDVTLSMFDTVLNDDTIPAVDNAVQIQAASDENTYLKLQNEQLLAELASARSEKEEVESRHRAAQGSIEDHRKEIDSLGGQLAAAKSQLATSPPKSYAEAQPTVVGNSGREQELEIERNVLRENASRLEGQLMGLQARYAEAQAIIAEQSDLAMRKDVSTAQPTFELAGDSGEEKPLLAAAYQQISVLNTQLAHLYTELTMARTEVQRLRSDQGFAPNRSGQAGDSDAEVLKQSQQIADLVSDIRHLQLDLEYHQQKLDQMIEEKQQMMRDLKKSQGDLDEAKRQIEERDQMLKHREVDLKQMREEMRSPRGGAGAQTNDIEGDGVLGALRAEAAAKDSALIVSHYELHKEKLLRDRLEQKNLKLMERMQKLMMVVETMRKENVTLERNLVAREQISDTKEQQLRQVTQKAKQLQKIAKAAKAEAGSKNGSKTVLELQSPLPPLNRSIDSGGRRSGASTPRSTPRAPASPYGTR